MASDAAAVACLKAGGDQCACVSNSASAVSCLGGCWPKVKGVLCAASAAEPTCDDAEVSPKLKECVASDAAAVACLKAGGDQCACVSNSASAVSCLGGCWPKVKGVLCPTSSQGAAPATRPCTNEDATARTKQCVMQEPAVVKCLRAGGKQCSCVRASASTMACLDECRPRVEAVLCGTAAPEQNAVCDTSKATEMTRQCVSKDAAMVQCLKGGSDKCVCFQQASSLAECLGACHAQILEVICGKSDQKPAAAAAATGTCTSSAMTKSVETCTASTAAWLSCAATNLANAASCSQQLQTAKSCYGTCWHIVAASFSQALSADVLTQGIPSEIHAAAQEPASTATPAEPAPPPPSDIEPAPTECSEVVSVDQTKKCVAVDVGIRQCLQGGTDRCACLADPGPTFLACMGACHSTILQALCGDEQGDKAEQAAAPPTPPTGKACTKDMALEKTRSCVVKDPSMITCLQEGRSQCTCLSDSSPELQGCLAECYPTIMQSMCPKEAAAEIAEPDHCDEEVGIRDAKKCVAADPGALDCLRGGASQCQCVNSGSLELRSCLGSCFDFVTDLLCQQDTEAAPEQATPAEAAPEQAAPAEVAPEQAAPAEAAPACPRTAAVAAAKKCVPASSDVMDCLRSGLSQCECLLQGKAAVQACMGPCWQVAYDAACKVEPAEDEEAAEAARTGTCSDADAVTLVKECVAKDGPLGECLKSEDDECACVSGASEAAKECMGGCFDSIRKASCEREAPGAATAAPACTKEVAVSKTRNCIAKNPEVLTCLKEAAGGAGKAAQCHCLKAPARGLEECMGNCLPTIIKSMCDE